MRTYVPRLFSVGANRQITFSPGNLQYNAAKGTHQCADGTTQPGTWRFAEHQWDMIGMGCGQTEGDVNTSPYNTIGGTVTDGNNRNISSTYNGWIDLFGWGTSGWNSGANCFTPWSTSQQLEDYYPGGDDANDLSGAYANADWGIYNQIGEDAPGSWRTLDKDEWYYLIKTRADASSKYGVAKVNGVTGIILLPDEWTLPTGCGFTAGMTSASNLDDWSPVATSNIYTMAQWSLMEAVGAVFLPCAGYHHGTTVTYAGTRGYYWSTSAKSDYGAYRLHFGSSYIDAAYNIGRFFGFPVRLVENDEPKPVSKFTPKPFSVSANKQVTFSSGNLQYNAAKGTHLCADGTTQQGTWRFAEHQWNFVGDAEVGNVYEDGVKSNNTLVSAGYNGWIDLFGWGTSGWNSGANAYQPYDTSIDNNDYNPGGKANKDITGEFAFADWGIYNQIENAPAGIWRSLTLQEWFYLLCYRTDAKKLFGLGNVEGINGLILLPDDWTTPPDVTFMPSTEKGLVLTSDGYQNSNKDNYSHNPYTYTQWQKMEAAGAVFLPAGGRFSEDLTNSPQYGLYWTSSNAGAKYACRAWFDNNSVYPGHGADRCIRRCVRPVRDITVIKDLVLYDNLSAAEYAAMLDEYKDKDINLTLQRRFNAGEWTTICLPFSLESLEDTPLDGIVYELTDATADNTNGITLKFFNTDKIDAGRPYLLWSKEDVSYMVFNGVRLLSFDEKPVTIGDETGDVVEFRPVMAPTRITERTSLYLSNNRLWYANQTSGNRLRAFCAYMELLHPENIAYLPARVSINGVPSDIEVVEGEGDDDFADESVSASASPARKYVENGILVIECGGKRYTATGTPMP